MVLGSAGVSENRILRKTDVLMICELNLIAIMLDRINLGRINKALLKSFNITLEVYTRSRNQRKLRPNDLPETTVTDRSAICVHDVFTAKIDSKI